MLMKHVRNKIRQFSDKSLNVWIMTLVPEVGSAGNGSELFLKLVYSILQLYTVLSTDLTATLNCFI